MVFFSGSVDQCAVGMIEKGAGIHVNPGGMMVTWFGYHCKREGLSSNPGVTLFFLFCFVWNKQHLPAVHHKQKINHRIDYIIATCQFVPEIKVLFPPKGYWMSPVLQLVITIPGLWLQSMLWLDSPTVTRWVTSAWSILGEIHFFIHIHKDQVRTHPVHHTCC
jgi:hypothetical protein